MLDKEAVKKLLASQKAFNSVPTIAAPIIEMANRPDTSIKDLSTIIEKDKELSARLLKIVNSGFYGLKNKVETVRHAVVLLGWNATKMIALGSSVLSRMCSTDRRLFNHSMRTAQIARFLAMEASFYKVEEIVVVGMLHDFGIMMFELFYPDRYARIRQYTIDKQIPSYIAEKELTGVTHADIGGWTLEEWNLPENITESVFHHHLFDPTSYHARKTAVIHVADILALAIDYKGPSWEKVPELSLSALDILGFSESDLRDMLLIIMKMKYEPIIL
jgi:HD-like signal output (HDOD) protein